MKIYFFASARKKTKEERTKTTTKVEKGEKGEKGKRKWKHKKNKQKKKGEKIMLKFVNGHTPLNADTMNSLVPQDEVNDLNIEIEGNSTRILYAKSTTLNTPVSGNSGFVIHFNNDTGDATQMFIANDEAHSTWRRSMQESTWQAWEKMERHTHDNKEFLDTITGFKTINGQSILGSGDIVIEGGGDVPDIRNVTFMDTTPLSVIIPDLPNDFTGRIEFRNLGSVYGSDYWRALRIWGAYGEVEVAYNVDIYSFTIHAVNGLLEEIELDTVSIDVPYGLGSMPIKDLRLRDGYGAEPPFTATIQIFGEMDSRKWTVVIDDGDTYFRLSDLNLGANFTGTVAVQNVYSTFHWNESFQSRFVIDQPYGISWGVEFPSETATFNYVNGIVEWIQVGDNEWYSNQGFDGAADFYVQSQTSGETSTVFTLLIKEN